MFRNYVLLSVSSEGAKKISYGPGFAFNTAKAAVISHSELSFLLVLSVDQCSLGFNLFLTFLFSKAWFQTHKFWGLAGPPLHKTTFIASQMTPDNPKSHSLTPWYDSGGKKKKKRNAENYQASLVSFKKFKVAKSCPNR